MIVKSFFQFSNKQVEAYVKEPIFSWQRAKTSLMFHWCMYNGFSKTAVGRTPHHLNIIHHESTRDQKPLSGNYYKSRVPKRDRGDSLTIDPETDRRSQKSSCPISLEISHFCSQLLKVNSDSHCLDYIYDPIVQCISVSQYIHAWQAQRRGSNEISVDILVILLWWYWYTFDSKLR